VLTTSYIAGMQQRCADTIFKYPHPIRIR